MRRQPAKALVDLDVTAEEPVGVVDVERQQTAVRALRAGHVAHSVGDEGRVLAQDRLLQGDQLRPRIDAQLSGQHRARLAQGAQRLTLAAGLVLGQGEQCPAPLAQRRRGDQRLRLGQHLAVLAALQAGVDAQLLGVETQLLETRGLDAATVPSARHRPAAGRATAPTPRRTRTRPAPVSPRVSSWRPLADRPARSVSTSMSSASTANR